MKYYATFLFLLFFLFYCIMLVMATLNQLEILFYSPFEFTLGFLLAFALQELLWDKHDKNP